MQKQPPASLAPRLLFRNVMLLPLLSAPLLFGGSFIMLTRLLLLAVRFVIATGADAGGKPLAAGAGHQ